MTQKIVINNCYGGFGLSSKAMILLIKRKAKCIQKLEIDYYYGGSKEYINSPCYTKNWKEKFEIALKRAKDFNDGFYGIWSDVITDKKYIYILNCKDEIRGDENLIQVVEELGEEANGMCAELKIVEIPDGVKWNIDEYDGLESIDEEHRSWS